MSITCPQCSQVNPDQSAFCVKCGNRFQMTGQTGPTFSNPSPPVYAASMSAPPSYSPSPGLSASAPYPYPAQMGTGQGEFSIRRAFAGRGVLVWHHSWLLNGKQVQAATVLTTILDILRQRNIGGLSITPERLKERGILIEERDYLTIRRGVATVFTYVAPAGQDLYISRATTVLSSINTIRVAGLLLLLALALFGPGLLPGIIGPAAYLLGGLFSLIALPIWGYFIWLLFRSFTHWLVEKDFWVYLRTKELNDFQLDDIALLEHVTDDTIRAAVEQLGLDASKIVPPTQRYQQKQRIRAI